jgi:two-component system, NtrC family, response regulator
LKEKREYPMADVLIIDDEEGILQVLSEMVTALGHHAICARDLDGGLNEARARDFDIVFLDVRLPDGNGLDILPLIRETPSVPEVIIMTGAGDPAGAELAIKNGAWDYLEKPASINEMSLPLIRALQYREEKSKEKSRVAVRREDIVGSSPSMERCLDFVARAAGSDASVLITGETGTGKELFANAIHTNSTRCDRSFVVVDCAALPETLVESTLFGHKKGAFTGADRDQEGLIKQADGGTLFLDEVGELPLGVQKAFLRVLQEHCFRSVGGREMTMSDFRLIAATNRDLDKMAEEGGFRKDLLFRMRSLTLELPPLREHSQDIRDICIHHMTRICEHYAIATKGFCPGFFDTLEAYEWPGNVRELISTIHGLIAMKRTAATLFGRDLPAHIRIKKIRAAMGDKSGHRSSAVDPKREPVPASSLGAFRDFRKAVVSDAEKTYLESIVSHSRRDLKEACSISGLSQSRFYELMQKHGLSFQQDARE